MSTIAFPRNTFKQALREGKPQIGLWVGLANAYTTELCAGAGFDWLLIDGEHAPNDLRSILAQLQAVAAYSAHPIVRPPVGDVALIKQLLEVGAQTLLIPMVESAGQAELLVKAMRYPPAGIRGVGSALARSSRFNRVPDYLNQANEQMCLLVQVENKAGLDQLEAIAAVPGVDGVFIGPADLSASLGYLGQPNHPTAAAAIDDALKRIIATGKAAGILTADEATARRYLTMGARFVAVGVDATLFARTVDALAAKFKSDPRATPAKAAPGAVY